MNRTAYMTVDMARSKALALKEKEEKIVQEKFETVILDIEELINQTISEHSNECDYDLPLAVYNLKERFVAHFQKQGFTVKLKNLTENDQTAMSATYVLQLKW